MDKYHGRERDNHYYEWGAEFRERQENCYPGHNIPFWGNPADELGNGTLRTADDIIEAFVGMLHSRSAFSCLHQAVEIKDFSHSMDLAVLKAGSLDEVRQPIALLDERIEAGSGPGRDKRGTRREYKGPLGAHGLWKELSRKRYKQEIPAHRFADPRVPSTTTSIPPQEQHPEEIDADRRLIYVVNLDRWSLLAIVSTAPKLQAEHLVHFVYKHLSFKCHIGVHIPASGFQNFALEFHFPFYAWRKSVLARVPSMGRSLIRDSRLRKPKGRPVRRSRDLKFLSMLVAGASEGSEDCLYEAQVSCLVSGVDQFSWTAYLFVDTYHKGKVNEESPTTYDEGAKANGLYLDPLTHGRHDANMPVWSPREYFVQVLDARLDQVQQEWSDVVDRILQVIEPYTYDDSVLEEDDRKLNDAELRHKDAQQLFSMTIRLLDRMSHLLDRTTDAWESFRQTDFSYFSDMEMPKQWKSNLSPHRFLLSCEKHVSKLRDLRKHVDEEKDLLRRFAEELAMGIASDDNIAVTLQQRTGEHVKALAVGALLFLPITATAAIFSVREGVLPIDSTVENFVLMTLILTIVLLAALAAVLKWKWPRLLGTRVALGFMRQLPCSEGSAMGRAHPAASRSAANTQRTRTTAPRHYSRYLADEVGNTTSDDRMELIDIETGDSDSLPPGLV